MADDSSAPKASAQDEQKSASPSVTNSEGKVAEGGPVEASDAMEVDGPSDKPTETSTENKDQDANGTQVADASAPPDSNGDVAAPSTSKKASSSSKRKSISGTPAKKLNRKKSMPDLHLNVSPGDFWYVQMKGYPPWPAVICDEDMLPESLLSKRPVSAKRVDGTYREDFEEGGKNVRDRRYPVMFLGTNEFAWQVNTDLAPLEIDDVKGVVERNEQGKKTKALWSAFQIAAEGHDLEYFKNMLKEHELHVMEEAQRAEEAEEAKAAKKEKKSKKTVDEDGDVEMADADENGEKKKPTKKRKKSLAEGEEAAEKKPKIVLKGLKSSGEEEPAKPKKARKSKGAAAAAAAAAAVSGSEEPEVKSIEEPVVSEEERLKKREKTIYYLRHKLQKGLVTRDRPPQPSDMDSMEEHLSVLEQHQDLEPSIIRDTKVNKLLKVILKLASIPRDEEFKFKGRCQKLLAAWTQILNNDSDQPKEPALNGLSNGKTEESKDESKAEASVEPAPSGSDNAVESTEPKEEETNPSDAAEADKAAEPVETS